jgi:dihydroorotate dehydrogenase electron transfer subunit
MNKRFDKNYRIIYNKNIYADYFELKVETDSVSEYCSPGQFFMIGIPGIFLRRPFGICGVKGETVSFLYKVVGTGTKILSGIKSGMLQLLGPLGRGYDLEAYKESKHVIVAGGAGIAPVHFLASRLKKKGDFYYGARTKSDLLYLNKFHKMGWNIFISTEDGSKGYKGYITDILSKQLQDNSALFTCGPAPMLKKVLQIAKEKNAKGFVSLEEKMACGLGNCQGCAVRINGQIKMTCKDGPVFKIEQVEL